MSLLRMEEVSSGYGTMRVIHGLNFSIEPGERIGLVGLNGHGKTTLISTIVGMTGWQDGSIEFMGQQIGGRRSHGVGRNTPKIVRSGIAIAPQGDAIFPGLSVEENLDSGAYADGAWKTRKRRRDAVLEVFPPLRSRLKQSAGTLSGAPKPRALEIIHDLEDEYRGLFGGVVGYFDFQGNADLAIAILTAVIRDGVARVQAGAGIVLDSDPESEYQETLAKAAVVLRAVSAANAMTNG